jgi:ribosome maturation factor RimP
VPRGASPGGHSAGRGPYPPGTPRTPEAPSPQRPGTPRSAQSRHPSAPVRAGGPPPADAARLTGLIEPVLTAMNLELEAVKVTTAGRRRVLRIIVDADGGVSLDDIALASSKVCARIDAKNVMGDVPYTLEVTSPGVDRPLTEPRHWRRAAGRLVAVRLTDQDQQSQRVAGAGQAQVKARVIGADQDSVTLEIDGSRHAFGYRELGPGRVQVEFGRLDEIDDSSDEIDDSGDVDSLAEGAEEEGRNGH